jgi:hypothetical protein
VRRRSAIAATSSSAAISETTIAAWNPFRRTTGEPPPAAAAGARRRAEPPPAKGVDRRVLEAFAVAWWADKRHRGTHAYTQNVIALGDFNLPNQPRRPRL